MIPSSSHFNEGPFDQLKLKEWDWYYQESWSNDELDISEFLAHLLVQAKSHSKALATLARIGVSGKTC